MNIWRIGWPSEEPAPRLPPSQWLRIDGRASRGEFRAFFHPFLTVVGLAVALQAAAQQARLTRPWADLAGAAASLATVLAYLAFFLLLTVICRRLHDLGHRGWLTWLYLIPPLNLGLLALGYFAKGQPEPNRYGPVPPQRVRLF